MTLAQTRFTSVDDAAQEIRRLIDGASEIGCLAHKDADADSLGSALAFAEALRDIGKSAHTIVPRPLPLLLRHLPDFDTIVEDPPALDLLFTFDCATVHRFGDRAGLVETVARVVNVDHHLSNDGFGDVNLVDPKASATGQVVYQLLRALGCPISPNTATNLYAALLTDTGGFRHENTTEAALRLGADLVGDGADPGWVALKSYKSRSVPQLRLEGLAIARLRSEFGGRLIWSEVTRAMLEEAGATMEESEGVIDQLQTVEPLKIALLFKEAGPAMTKVSVRSRDEVDALDLRALRRWRPPPGRRRGAPRTPGERAGAGARGGAGAARARRSVTASPPHLGPRRSDPAAAAAQPDPEEPEAPARRRPVCGVLPLDKQPGQTSFACVQEVRRILRERKVGHAGTLDPSAQGLLPILVGPATRLVDHLHQQLKRYRCTVRLGARSDTLDSEGRVSPGADAAGLDEAAVRVALQGFVGEITQVPPMHSAVRHEGAHLYELARRGEEVERSPRPALIVTADLVAFRPGRVAEADLEVECGKGTYMRVLAADLGDALGVGGYLSWLERTRYGALGIADAHTLAEVRALEDPTAALLPPEVVVGDLPAVFLGPPAATQVRRGQAVFLPRAAGGLVQGETRAHTASGELIALGEVTGNRFQPTKVLAK
ncbi:MAG TPA: tRNA pseudouridine(55) synthase TruB [Candidatus Binatia bacterium]|nr:tRNA pseudouridine(55) synthase TruB [Candidatus Binatia bacterium]